MDTGTENRGGNIVEAKKVYTQQLVELLTPYLYEGFKLIFDHSKNEKKNVLIKFQEKCADIHLWNQEIINKEYNRIIKKMDNKDLIDKLLEAVFISNVKVLSSVAFIPTKSINIKIPETKNFIHKCYINCARYFYQDPYVMDDRQTSNSHSEILRNFTRSTIIIGDAIEKTVRDCIPIQDILDNYLNQEEPTEPEFVGGGGDGFQSEGEDPSQNKVLDGLFEKNDEGEVEEQQIERDNSDPFGATSSPLGSDREDPFMQDPDIQNTDPGKEEHFEHNKRIVIPSGDHSNRNTEEDNRFSTSDTQQQSDISHSANREHIEQDNGDQGEDESPFFSDPE